MKRGLTNWSKSEVAKAAPDRAWKVADYAAGRNR